MRPPDPGPPAIPFCRPYFDRRDAQRLVEPLRCGRLGQGERVERLERAAAQHLGVAHVVAACSGAGALRLALLCAGVGPGQEVVLGAWGEPSAAAAVELCGARPVFCDLDPETLTLDPEAARRRLEPPDHARPGQPPAGPEHRPETPSSTSAGPGGCPSSRTAGRAWVGAASRERWAPWGWRAASTWAHSPPSPAARAASWPRTAPPWPRRPGCCGAAGRLRVLIWPTPCCPATASPQRPPGGPGVASQMEKLAETSWPSARRWPALRRAAGASVVARAAAGWHLPRPRALRASGAARGGGSEEAWGGRDRLLAELGRAGIRCRQPGRCLPGLSYFQKRYRLRAEDYPHALAAERLAIWPCRSTSG